MAEHDPETGYPRVNLSEGQAFNPDDIFNFTNGRRATGAQLNEVLRHYFEETARGQQLMRAMQGEGPEPELLYSLVTDESNVGRVMLGGSDVDVTEVDPLAPLLLDELLEERRQQGQ